MTFLVGVFLFVLFLAIVGRTYFVAYRRQAGYGRRRARRREQAATLEGAGSHLRETP